MVNRKLGIIKMCRLTFALVVVISVRCFGSTFDYDTIDNWQVYHGETLILSGHGSMGTNLRYSMAKEDLGDLTIQYSHCVAYRDLVVALKIVDEAGRVFLEKQLISNSRMRLSITKGELMKLNFHQTRTWSLLSRE